ncbi:MAG: hypothetical protein ACUVTN_04490 [Thermodesulfobacteriota bacterium]
MEKIIILLFLLTLFFGACESKTTSTPSKTENPIPPKVTIEKERKDIEAPPPEVKIKLKRDGKDNYSWELSGSDADEILKINEKLKKKLGGEQRTPP